MEPMFAHRRPLLWRQLVRILGLCAIAVAGLLLPPDDVGATSFSPQWQASLSDPAPGANATLRLDLSIPAPDANFSAAIAFLPSEFGVTPGVSITDGALSGHVSAVATLGLINGACNTNLNVEIELMDASIDPTSSIDLYYGVDDHNGNGLPDNVDYYPYLLTFIAPDLVPVQRLYGQVPVSGVKVPLNFVIFPAGTQIPLLPAFDPALGYPTLTIVGDPFAVPGPTFPVSDWCTPLTSTVVLDGVSRDNPALNGNQAGQSLRTNPVQAGVYNSVVFARGRWDADNDGIDNTLDSCPLTADPTWDPRSTSGSGDADSDGLADSCDPNDSSHNTDNDGDQFLNRLDLCPTFRTTYLHYDNDRDGIGNECDPLPDDESQGGAAHRHALCVSDTVTVGSPSSGPPAYTCPSGPDLPIPPRLTLYPSVGYETLGTVHSLWVSARRVGAQEPAVGYTVSFTVTGANTAAGTCLTSNYGDCQFNYLGLNEGVDTISATASIDGFDLMKSGTNHFVGPPANDAFAAATAVSELPFEEAAIPLAATEELGEPNPCGELRNTVWYSFTPETGVFVTAEVETAGSPAALAVYTGSTLSGLTLIECDSSFGQPPLAAEGGPDYSVEEYVAFRAQAGVTYYFQAGPQFGFYGGEPQIVFKLGESVIGDVNCSGTLNSIDALGVLRKSAGLPAPPCGGNGDVNCDGSQNAIDALLILRVSAALMPQPVSCPG